MILRYPDGVSGIALLLLRLSHALAAFPSLVRLWPSAASEWSAVIPAAVMAVALVAGFGTRAAALLLTLVLAGGLLVAPGGQALLYLASASSAGALVLLGPGAYSIDARRFGRRVIRLEPRSPDRGGPA